MSRYSELYVDIVEGASKLSLQKFVDTYKNIYSVGDCKSAAKKVQQRVEGFVATPMRIDIMSSMYNYVQTHWYAKNGNIVVDLTAPKYIELFIQQGIASVWHKRNRNKVQFNANDYEDNFSDMI